MKLSTEEVGLLRSLIEWRRKTGWSLTVNRYDRDDKTGRHGAHQHEYDHPSGPRVDVDRFRYEDESIQVEVTAEDGSHRLFQGWPLSVRTAVNTLGAVEVIPPEMVPMFQAGKKAVYDRAEYRVTTPSGERPGSRYPEYSAIEAFKMLGFWRRNGWHDAYLEMRWDKEPSDWERVAEAVDSRQKLIELLNKAAAAGRESAYTTGEWRVCSGPANKQLPQDYQFPYIYADEIESAEDAALELARAKKFWASEESWIEHRRTGATDWSRVDV